MSDNIGFHEAREMWTPKLIDILNKRNGGTETAVSPANLPVRQPTDPIPDYLERQRIVVESVEMWLVSFPREVGYSVIFAGWGSFYGFEFYDENGGPHFVLKENVPLDEITYYPEYGVAVYLTNGTKGPDAESAYYNRFGLDRLDVPADCEYLGQAMPRAVEMFNERYSLRMINRETLETWQMGLQSKFDTIAYRYERAFALYADNAEEMSNVLEKKVTTRSATSTNSGSDTTTYGRKDTFAGTVKNIDTPDSAINANANYADSLTKNDNSNQASGTDTLTHGLVNTIADSVTETKEPEGGIVEATNRSMDAWRDLTAEFVKEFENNFLNVFWY